MSGSSLYTIVIFMLILYSISIMRVDSVLANTYMNRWIEEYPKIEDLSTEIMQNV